MPRSTAGALRGAGHDVLPLVGLAHELGWWVMVAVASAVALFPPATSLAKCEFMRDLGPVIALYDRYWTEIKAR